MDKTKKRFDKYNISEAVIFFAGAFLRIFRLGTLPSGVYIDEPPMAYSAWCIANYGVDRYLRHMPVYFQNWYSGQSPMYTYLLALLYKLRAPMGNAAVIRLPACFFGILMLFLVYFTVKELTTNGHIRFFALFCTAFCPYFVMQSRLGLDCNLLLFWSMFSLLFLIRYCKGGKLSDLVICGVLFGLSLYTYALSYILLGIFLVLAALYLLRTKKIDVKRTLLWAVIVVAVSLPVILFAISVVLRLPEYSFLGFTVAPVSSGRLSELSGKNFIKNAILSLWAAMTHDDHYALTVDEFSTLYYISIPFVIVGACVSIVNFVKSAAKKEFCFDGLFVLFALSNAVVGGMNGEVLVYRINAVFAAYLYFLVKGVYVSVGAIKKEPVKKAAGAVLALIYAGFAFMFVGFYFSCYTRAYDGFTHSASDAIGFARENEPGMTVYVDYMGLSELLLWEEPISPYEWNESETVNGVVPKIPEEFDIGAGYIIRKSDSFNREKILGSGTDIRTYEFEDYALFIIDR
ncbi:MAG: glycosyltransferase family 39 protein [Lachnospiraceae bacterium]|nr:glycosyltransferase family 39 protein [Lachnospiraceae bacterium]